MTHPTTAPAALVRHARLVADLRTLQRGYVARLAELDRELADLAAERAELVAAALAACPDAAADRLRATIAGIDADFWGGHDEPLC